MEKLKNREITALLFSWNRRMMTANQVYIVQDQKGIYISIIAVIRSEMVDSLKMITKDEIIKLGFKGRKKMEEDFKKRYKKPKNLYFVEFVVRSVMGSE